MSWFPGKGEGGAGLRRRRWREISSTSIAIWGSTALAFLASVIVARALGPNEYGGVVLAIATAALIATFLDLTLEQAVVYYGFQALEKEDVPRLRALVQVAFILDMALGLLISTAMFVLADPIAELVSDGRLDPTLIRVAALTVLAATMDGTTGAVLLLENRTELRAWAMAVTNLARLIAMSIAAIVGSAEAVIIAYAAATAAGSGWQAFLSWRVGWRKWQGAAQVPVAFWSTTKKLASFAMHSSLAASVLSATDSVIYVILGRASGPAEVAYFRVAMLPQMAAALATSPMRLWMFPRNAKLAAAGRVGALKDALYNWSAISLVVAVPAVIAGWFALPRLITTIYGESFAGATDAARILLVAAFCIFVFPWTKNLLAVIGRPQVATALASLLLVVCLPVTILFSEHGAEAGAWGLSAGTLLMTLGYLVVARSYFKGHPREPANEPDERGTDPAPSIPRV